MKNKLYGLQKDAYDSILNAIKNGEKRIIIQFATGLGKNKIISALSDYFNDNRVLILYDKATEVEQCKEIVFRDNLIKNKIGVTTYESVPKIHDFDIIIANNIDYYKGKSKTNLIRSIDNQICIFFSNFSSFDNNVYNEFKLIYSTNNNDTILTELSVIKNLYIPLLEKTGFSDIEIDKIYNTDFSIRPDITAKKDEVTYIFETKQYRSHFGNIKLVENATKQINRYKKISDKYKDNYKFGLILLCDLNDDFKQTLEEENEIFILDIKNLLSLCENDSFLISQLQKYVYYSLDNIEKAKLSIDFSDSIKITKEISDNSIATGLIDKIKNCKTGNNYSKQYENICYDVINYLFDNDFSQISKQYTTKDKMFRMDILCSIKGIKEFWYFLMHFYHTKFVVFESKNYSDKIEQNLIYVTEKYLFDSALRNVAFIISRKGFDNNAIKAAIGVLREHNKLIIDITDTDLINMINDKSEGKEPTDYLFNKVEMFLMGISK
ncbi:MAG: DEAD/DEAH box helicase family protein [Eubacterium sp.]|nr:DEAD/DEAH box helicase family protein [Eubacterium sp.]